MNKRQKATLDSLCKKALGHARLFALATSNANEALRSDDIPIFVMHMQARRAVVELEGAALRLRKLK